MHTRPILTIAIPTYNRAACLAALLSNLKAQLPGIPSTDVEILISDNCSTDDTPKVAAAFRSTHDTVKLLRNDENRGADYNIARCFIEASGLFVWILGDDDIVQPGALAGILAVLRADKPNLTFLNAVGFDGEPSDLKLPPVTLPLATRKLNRTTFAKYANINLTFISGMIIRKDSYAKANDAIFAGLGTSLIQLEWNINALLEGETFTVVTTPVVHARVNQSGGYRLFDVFVTNYLALVRSMCKNNNSIKNILISYALIGYLPRLIYEYRFASVGHFERQSILSVLYQSARSRPEFWLILAPIAVLPRPMAFLFNLAAKIVNRVRRGVNGLR